MTDKVNIYELMAAYWRENDYEPFSTAETALFLFLVGKCNSRHWKMPVKCPTSVVCRSIKVSKQTVITACETLRDRGLIRYTKGNGNSDAPSYTIITDPRKWTDELTIIKPDSLTDNQTTGKTEYQIIGMVIYGNSVAIHSDELSSCIFGILFFWIISLAAFFLIRKYLKN